MKPMLAEVFLETVYPSSNLFFLINLPQNY
jgi:hypothetical protein